MASARASAAEGLAGKAAGSMKLAGDDLGDITEIGRIDTTTPRWSAIGGEDGQGWPPWWTVFKNPPRDYLYACIVCGILTLATVVGVVWQIRRQRSCPQGTRRSLHVRMFVLVLVLALTAICGLSFAKVGVIFVSFRATFVSISVLWIVELMIEMPGGFVELCYAMAAHAEEAAVLPLEQHASDSGIAGMPVLNRSSVTSASVITSHRKLMAVWYCTQQFVIVTILMSSTFIALAALGLYEEGVLPSSPSLLGMKVLQVLSAVIAIVSLAVLHAATNPIVLRNKYHCTGKIVFVQGAIIISHLQPMALAVLMAYSMLPETPMFASPARSTLWNNMMVTIETLLLLVVAIRSFPVNELFDPEVRQPRTLPSRGIIEWNSANLRRLFPGFLKPVDDSSGSESTKGGQPTYGSTRSSHCASGWGRGSDKLSSHEPQRHQCGHPEAGRHASMVYGGRAEGELFLSSAFSPQEKSEKSGDTDPTGTKWMQGYLAGRLDLPQPLRSLRYQEPMYTALPPHRIESVVVEHEGVKRVSETQRREAATFEC